MAGKRGERKEQKWKCSSVFVAHPICCGDEKSLSFDSDAVVLFPMFMKCLFCFFNEIFNVKVFCFLRAFCFFFPSRKHAKSNFAQKQFSGVHFISPKKKHISNSFTYNDNGMWSFFRVSRKTIFPPGKEKYKKAHKKFSLFAEK